MSVEKKPQLKLRGISPVIERVEQVIVDTRRASEFLKKRQRLQEQAERLETLQEQRARIVGGMRPILEVYDSERPDLTLLVDSRVQILSPNQLQLLERLEKKLVELEGLPKTEEVRTAIAEIKKVIAQNQEAINNQVGSCVEKTRERITRAGDRVKTHYGTKIEAIEAEILTIETDPGVQQLLRAEEEKRQVEEREVRQAMYRDFREKTTALGHKLRDTWQAIAEEIGDGEIRSKLFDMFETGYKPGDERAEYFTSIQSNLTNKVREAVTAQIANHSLTRLVPPEFLVKMSPWMDKYREERKPSIGKGKHPKKYVSKYLYDELIEFLRSEEIERRLEELRNSSAGVPKHARNVEKLVNERSRLLLEETILGTLLRPAWTEYRRLKERFTQEQFPNKTPEPPTVGAG